MGLSVLQQTIKYGMRGQVKSNTGFQTEGRCKPLSRFMALLLVLISMPSIVLCSQCPSILALTLPPLLQCCDGSLVRGPQCHCWGYSSVRPICAQPCGSSGFSSIPRCTRGHSCYRESGTQPLSSCRPHQEHPVGHMNSPTSSFYIVSNLPAAYAITCRPHKSH